MGAHGEVMQRLSGASVEKQKVANGDSDAEDQEGYQYREPWPMDDQVDVRAI
jgi:hypothetical protein